MITDLSYTVVRFLHATFTYPGTGCNLAEYLTCGLICVLIHQMHVDLSPPDKVRINRQHCICCDVTHHSFSDVD